MWHLNRARRDSSRPIPVNVVAIEAFYSRHDSREAPSMKDMVIIRTAGFKEMKQKWHLLYKLREVYAMFWEEHGNKVSACSATYVQSMRFSAEVRRVTRVCVRHMRTSSVWPMLYCQHTIGNGVLRMQIVDLRKDACSINVQLAKTAQS